MPRTAWARPRTAAGSPEPEELVFLLEYIAIDYGLAVRDGSIVNDSEYREMLAFSQTLVDHFDVFWQLGATQAIEDEIRKLQDTIHRRQPWSDVKTLADGLVDRIQDALGVVSLPVVPPDLDRGRRLYAEGCAPCHGSTGRGDGFAAPGLNPPVASFAGARLNLLSPHSVFGAITFGIDGTAMPSYRYAQTREELWDIAFFVMTLRSDFNPRPPEEDLSVSLADLASHSNDALLTRLRRTWAGVEAENVDYYRQTLAAAPPAAPAGEENRESRTFVAAMGALKHDPDPRIRRWAAWKLGSSKRLGPEGAEALVGALEDDDELVRRYAADPLGRPGVVDPSRLIETLAVEPRARPQVEQALIALGRPVVAKLIPLLGRNGSAEQASAIRVVAGIGPAAEEAVPSLIEAMEAQALGATGVRLAAALGEIGTASVPPLIRLFRETHSARTKELAGRALGFAGPAAEAAVPALLNGLAGDSARIRFTSAIALGEIGPQRAVVPLVDRLREDTSRSVRMHCIRALESFGPAAAEAAPALIDVFGRDDNLSGEARRALVAIGAPALPDVLEALRRPDARVRASSALVLGGIGGDVSKTAPRLVRMLGDPEDLVSNSAATALTRMGNGAAPYLIEAVTENENPRVRGYAILALGRADEPVTLAVPSLMRALDDAVPLVRQLACWSLGRIGSEAAASVAGLTAKLRSNDVVLRRTAAWALGNIGPAAAPALPALNVCSRDPQPSVRDEAVEAVQKILGTYEFPSEKRKRP